ncbi:leucine--tRNA ligase [Calidifontimicrobium sp. SYSU G02091]|uniref:leucine--tRNA ligase n=1 Tax=Calidifontimicrobium sp. SYSU G02091 TaxID=2926421 RepID=UPI001F534D10|nr:leucine--tRNA ligase [Calidifontimicrobium sp. SYSU G02091]MCI1190230.1 leucine--tRNA ligase [Calidifontimicrobium sp. SYSU G02091]
MNEKYVPAEVEAAAQRHWAERDAYRVREDAGKPKYYACSMLPYPSGKLHMGHVRNYTINDMLARQLRMRGYNVLMPMGWDAFGLPAENAAMKNKVPPAEWTYSNIAHMKGQMQAMGLAIDWSREVTTCRPDYYKWNQWLFLKMLDKGIAERRTQVVNWDPVDQTVLANEQVIDGRGWRSGAPVEKREIPGYYLKITDYAEELLAAVADPADKNFLAGWPERVRLMQEHWIGKSEGVRFAFLHDIRGDDGQPIGGGRLYVFTTRADTIMGVTFCAVAPEHPLAAHAAQTDPALAAFIDECKKGGTTEAELATKDKAGLPTGLTVTHPLTGEAVPLWVGNYVLMGYGDGAVMGVPAHDERDFAFAKKYGLPIKQVIAVEGQTFSTDAWAEWYADKARGRCVHSGVLDGLDHKAAVDKVAALLAAKGLGEKKVTWRLRDWGISRQRYWGTPIPIIHCDACGVVPVPEKDLPVVLPEDLIPDGSGNPLARCASFLNVACPTCGQPARRETDTMDTFVDSSWYFMRYCDPTNEHAMVGEGTRHWMPMDQYIGGIEHAILHLLYARFWTKVMRDLGLVQIDEPFTRLLTQGMVLNHIYSRRGDKGGIEYFWPHEVENVYDDAGKIVGARLKSDGSPVDYEGVGTMSKSKNNGVDPQELIDRYGADTARLFVMFASPPEQTLEWNDAGVEGAHRFLKRLWAFGVRHAAAIRRAAAGDFSAAALRAEAKALRREVHLVLRQVSYDYERLQYNTVVSGCMKLLNALEGFAPDGSDGDTAVLCEATSVLLRALYPACPHVTHALWVELGYAARLGDLIDAPWPQVDDAALTLDEVELVLQVNGKHRGAIRVPAQADRAAIEAAAVASPEFARFAEGRAPKKVVVVPGRLVNVVV